MPATGQEPARQRSGTQLTVHGAANGSSTIDTVQEALAALAAREAQFRPMPEWVRPELATSALALWITVAWAGWADWHREII